MKASQRMKIAAGDMMRKKRQPSQFEALCNDELVTLICVLGITLVVEKRGDQNAGHR